MNLYNLKELELTPNGNLIIENDESEFAFTINNLIQDLNINHELNYLPVEYILQNFGSSYRLKGDTIEEKEKFRNRQREKEIEHAKLEKLKKKKEMEQVRRNLELDKKERLEKLEKLNNLSSNSHSPSAIFDSSNSNSNSNNSSNSSSNNVISISSCNINTPCSIQVRLPNGNCVKIENTLYGKNTLNDLYQQVLLKISSDGLKDIRFDDLQFRRQYPNMDFDSRQFKKVTLLEAQLVPRGLIVLSVKKH
ncbi:predicted protein [Naegleria gruberi]|uniref:Predicted protein n=1 Tax=Naegleria gruberi TaxID=5762 RepID=D2V8L1_NAEGR|nr:uncharacterized protein NAEGRDRAFT_65197 [Naegleria gruberi]EFC46822.1 predicted protein [Naegleria gruberi]|eukprot:XP_002679566.1 predicted protein [Naegleria gruberi strain NEG-M]